MGMFVVNEMVNHESVMKNIDNNKLFLISNLVIRNPEKAAETVFTKENIEVIKPTQKISNFKSCCIKGMIARDV
jgi:hypothetical protein